ncbi:hypothetical protein FOZ61_002286 [Perkinsus olseni]|uniref:C3H1-type domain-containing protein n=1 Tax=Perkinsus olseni TaxID=32597 RepID=A0A7J6LTT5_PEROL|nr:hypothetical protein FOZ61_002286 [Perkinsus olseni]
MMPASPPTPTSTTTISDEFSVGTAADTATSKALGSLMSQVFQQPPPFPESAEDTPDDDLRSGTDTRIFHKTRVCVYYKSDRGCVHGDNCLYAHGEEDLKIAPDLRKTTLCDRWEMDACPLSASECRFAHGREDLRAVDMSTSRSQASTASHTPVFDRHRREVMTPVVRQTPERTRMKDSAARVSGLMGTPPFTSEGSLGTSGSLSATTPVSGSDGINPCPCTPEESVNALTQLVGALHQQHTQAECAADEELSDSATAQEAQILMHQQQQALEAYLQASPLNPAAAAAALLGIHSYSQYEQALYPPLNPMITPFPMPGFGDYVPALPVPMPAMLPRSEDVQTHFHSNGIRQKVVDPFAVRDSAERRKLFLERYGRQHRENNDSVERRVRLMEFIGVEYADRSIGG